MEANPTNSDGRCSRRTATVASVVMAVALSLPTLQASGADPVFVGALSLIEESDVAEQLHLTAKQKEKLLALIESRENEAVELAMKLRGLSAAEREKELAPFRRESEARAESA